MSQEKRFLWDDRAPSFRLLADATSYIAKRNGVKLDETTYNRVSDMGGLIREVDTLRDDMGATAEEILALLNNYSDFEEVYPHLSPEALGEEKWGVTLSNAEEVFGIGARAILLTDPYEYARLRLDESIKSAQLVTDIATDPVTSVPAYGANFVPAMENFTVGVTFFDSLLDGFIDYRKGKTNVKPDWEYYTAIRNVGRTGMRSVMKLMFTGPILPVLTLEMARQRIHTRVRNGMTEYSTMQNVPDFFRHITRRKPKQP